HRANLDIRRKTNAHVLALLAKLSLLSAQSFVVSELQCSIESPFVVCTVVDHPARGLEWEFARLRKVFPTNLSGIDFQFLCSDIYDSLDQVSRFRASGTPVCIGRHFVCQHAHLVKFQSWDFVAAWREKAG